ncbi:MAG: CoA transferase, partial [Pseudomonadota bacterium]
TAAMAIAAALNADPRGCVIDVSMMEAVMATMGWAVSNWLIAGVAPARVGNENVTSAPSGTFAAADGPLNVAANRDEQWQTLARHLGREDLLRRPEFATREARKANRNALRDELETVLTTRPAADWARELAVKGVPAGAVLSVPQALEHPQISQRGLVATYDDVPGVGRPVRALRTAVKLDGAAPAVATPPPVLGADTSAILVEAGYCETEIEEMRKEGAL